ncbi:MAG: hypothetical protein P1U56_08445 [Saprospiraceae bacterium]|nr:hypothetical protein [Saprospiraceae bacterium]
MQVDLYWSHDLALQSLSANGGSGQDLVNQRSDSESLSYSYSLGGRFGFTFPSGMGIKTGLNISKVRTSFNFTETDGMDPPLVTNMISSNNTYTYVDIPILFTLERSGYGPFYYNFNAGVLFNMTFTANGMFLDPNGNVVEFTKGAENRFNAYEKTAGTSFYASFGMHYVWNDIIDLVIEPNFRYSLGPVTLNNYLIDEKFTTVGLITGIRYKF